MIRVDVFETILFVIPFYILFLNRNLHIVFASKKFFRIKTRYILAGREKSCFSISIYSSESALINQTDPDLFQ